MLRSLIAIAIGAAAGANLRWWLGKNIVLAELGKHSLFFSMSVGTLFANLLGGYLIGIALSLFNLFPSVAPEFKLMVITGFLGALTTFSSFSAEMVALLQGGRVLCGAMGILFHVMGSLLMTLLGIGTVALFKHLWA
ncbi:putative fluoride ion transporter CrcB [invertebrate metagenome]|uniref:Putative fluoride ion transporter CrcB n=1 Tax=invertebrate metagenome TaxID=1711999 RepID=A0A2H9T8Z6_9ZZZZ